MRGDEKRPNQTLTGAGNYRAFTEYLSQFCGFELFPCPNRFTPYRPFLRGKEVAFGHPVAVGEIPACFKCLYTSSP
jgi:hypothetical protein